MPEVILNNYNKDFSKHAPTEMVPRIKQLWKSVPAQLSRENKKFIYGAVKGGARASENVSAPRLPLNSYEESSSFKIFMLDIGLLGALLKPHIAFQCLIPPIRLDAGTTPHNTPTRLLVCDLSLWRNFYNPISYDFIKRMD